MRLIDADALNYVRVRIYHDDGTIGGYNSVVPSSEIKNAPTVDAIPVKWLEDRVELFRECEADLMAQSLETEIYLWKAKNRIEE